MFRYPDVVAQIPRDSYEWFFLHVPDIGFAAAAHRRCVEYLANLAIEGQS